MSEQANKRAYIIVKHAPYIKWEIEPNDLKAVDFSGLCWVNGQNEEELIAIAKRRFENIFQIEDTKFEYIENGPADAVITLDVHQPYNSSEPQVTEIKTNTGYTLKRTSDTSSTDSAGNVYTLH